MRGKKPEITGPHSGRSHHKAQKSALVAPGVLSISAPRWLSKAERLLWRAIVMSAPSGLLRAADGPAVARLCMHRAAVESLHARLQTLDVESKEAGSLFRILKAESEMAGRLEDSLALGSPTARRRVLAVDPPLEPTEFEAMRNRLANKQAK